MRIVAGLWRGRTLTAPEGRDTRPTADRVRQALFDMLLHAPWAGRSCVEGAHVLDLFAGTGALGLEALSRGAADACFVENAPAALRALRANIAAVGAANVSIVVAADVLSLREGAPASLVFMDPPYGGDLAVRALTHLRAVRVITSGTLVVAETGRDEPSLPIDAIEQRSHGAARLTIWRES